MDPATGQLISLTFSRAAAGNDTFRNITGISENTLVAGFIGRPMDTLRITGDFQFGYNDYSFTRINPRQVQSYKIHANYKPRAWINLDGAVDIHENRDNVSTVDDFEHDRSYSFVITLMPKSKVYYDLGYTYTDISTQAQICYYQNAFGPAPTTPCPASLGYSPAAMSGLGSGPLLIDQQRESFEETQFVDRSVLLRHYQRSRLAPREWESSVGVSNVAGCTNSLDER